MRVEAGAPDLQHGGPPRVRGWEPCREALLDPRLTSDPCLVGLASAPANNLLFMDGELHRRLRNLVMPYMTARHLDATGRRLASTCRSLVGSALESPTADLVADVAEPLTLEAIFSAMEVPPANREALGRLAHEMLGLLEPDLPPAERRRATAAAMRATRVFREDWMAGRARGLHAALEAAAEEGAIPEKLARSTPVVILHGGYENPLNQLGCLIASAVESPGRFKRAAAMAPDLLFEEVARVFSPVRLVARWATGDRAGARPPLEEGQLVWVDLESANRDRRFAPADEFDLSRRRRHLGFGHGAHACPGTSLARLEGRALIETLASLPDDALREFAVEWRAGIVARGPARIGRG